MESSAGGNGRELKNKSPDEITPEEVLCKIIGTKNQELEKFRLFLMACACINILGFPMNFGSFLQTFCGFAPIAFFILSGILVLADPQKRKERIERSIKRTAIVFACMLVLDIAVNLVMIFLFKAESLPQFNSPRLWIDFIFFNIWPFEIGGAIWYVQSLLYAYIIIYFIEKLNLWRLDIKIFAGLFVFSFFSGEFFRLINLSILGYTHLPFNFLNCALPYILLGGILTRAVSSRVFFNPVIHMAGAIAGLGLIIAELGFLSRYGSVDSSSQLFGMVVLAVSLCLLIFSNMILRENTQNDEEEDPEEAMILAEFGLSRRYTNIIYFLCQPVAALLGFLVLSLSEEFYNKSSSFLGVVTFVILLFTSYGVKIILRKRKFIKLAMAEEELERIAGLENPEENDG